MWVKKAKEAGAETKADIAVFLVGAGAGGIADAVANSFGFVEPFVAAGLCGTGALGLKKLLWDVPRESKSNEMERNAAIEALKAEAALLRKHGDAQAADLLDDAIKEGTQRNLDADQIRELYEKMK